MVLMSTPSNQIDPTFSGSKKKKKTGAHAEAMQQDHPNLQSYQANNRPSNDTADVQSTNNMQPIHRPVSRNKAATIDDLPAPVRPCKARAQGSGREWGCVKG